MRRLRAMPSTPRRRLAARPRRLARGRLPEARAPDGGVRATELGKSETRCETWCETCGASVEATRTGDNKKLREVNPSGCHAKKRHVRGHRKSHARAAQGSSNPPLGKPMCGVASRWPYSRCPARRAAAARPCRCAQPEGAQHGAPPTEASGRPSSATGVAGRPPRCGCRGSPRSGAPARARVAVAPPP